VDGIGGGQSANQRWELTLYPTWPLNQQNHTPVPKAHLGKLRFAKSGIHRSCGFQEQLCAERGTQTFLTGKTTEQWIHSLIDGAAQRNMRDTGQRNQYKLQAING
jgi:hypothetical protein